MPGRRLRCAWVHALLLLLLLPLSPAWAQQPTTAGANGVLTAEEAPLKAAFLYNFVLYASWPSMPAEGLTMCVLGQDDMGPAFDALAGKLIHGKSVKLRRLAQRPSRADECQLLFVAASQHAAMPAVSQALQGLPVLIVADAGAYAPELPMIMLEREGSRLVFQVNLGLARAAGLRLDPKLLRLAKVVR